MQLSRKVPLTCTQHAHAPLRAAYTSETSCTAAACSNQTEEVGIHDELYTVMLYTPLECRCQGIRRGPAPESLVGAEDRVLGRADSA